MGDQDTKSPEPDFFEGVELSAIPDSDMLKGHVQGEPALLVRRGQEHFIVGAVCTHYGGPLVEGLLVDGEVRCPWHHASFSLRSGRAIRAPALAPLPCWQVDERDGKLYAGAKIEPTRAKRKIAAGVPSSVVIVGGGAAGNAAAEELRKEGYSGKIQILSADRLLPCDRPSLSKGYLAGAMGEDSNLLRSADFYRDQEIEVTLSATVGAIDVHNHCVQMVDGRSHPFEALVLATGAEPVRLDMPGATLPHVHYLRTVDDSRAIVANALTSKRAVVIGSSFIGMEVAASLRAREIDVHVVGLEAVPMEKVLGKEVGSFMRKLHEDHGVTFHMGTTAQSIDERQVKLANGKTLDADLVVIGVGVRPRLELAQQAGLAINRGVMVDEYLRASAPGIFAAGDIARWPYPLTGERIRVEHFVVAERQGQTAARNIIGHREKFDAVPFFWTRQYNFGLAYVGYAGQWDQVDIDGSLDNRDCTLTYRHEGKKLAVAVVNRDLQGLRAEAELECMIASKAGYGGSACKSHSLTRSSDGQTNS